MATLTAEATLGTALSVDCGHHLATYQSQKLHVTEFRKPVAVKRNSKTAETQTGQGLFDSTASSGMGAWESVLDYSQYNVTANDKQEITLANDARLDTEQAIPGNIFSDSGRVGLVFDFTEYHECTAGPSTGNIVVKYTAKAPLVSPSSLLELRTTNDGTSETISNETYVISSYVEDDYIFNENVGAEYTTSLDDYTIDDGFVTVWFKGPGVTISNITARITCVGKARASVTPVYNNTPTIFNNVIETEEFDTATNPYERDSIITFDNINLSAWPSTLQAEAFEVDSLTNFIGIEDIDATTYVGYVNYTPGTVLEQRKTISSDRVQATENVNFPDLVSDYELSPTSSIQLVDNNPQDINNQSWRVGFGGKGYIEFDDHIFLPCVNRTDAEELEQFNALTISVWWYGDTIPSTFFMADDADASYNVNSDFGDRSVKLTHEATTTYNKFQFSYATGGVPPFPQSNFFGSSARNTLTANFLLNQYVNADGWNNLLISFVPHTDLEYRDILNGISHPLSMKVYLNNTAANSISAVNTPELGTLPVTQSLANEMYIIANPDISDASGSFRSQFESVNTILNAKYRGDGNASNLGVTEDTQNAYYFIDNQYIDLDVQSNRQIFRNLDGTPATNPQINGQTPKAFISGNDKTINNLGTLPITKLNVVQRNLVTEAVDTLVGAAPTARIIAKQNGVNWDRDVFEAQNGYPVVTYKRIAGGPLTLYQQTQLASMGIDLAYVYPAQGTFTNGFIKTKLLLKLNLTSGPVNTQANFSVAQPDIDMILGADVTLASNFDVDTTTGKIHLFRFDPLTFNTAFTTTQTGSRLVTGIIETSGVYVDDDYVVEDYYDQEGGIFAKFTLSQPDINNKVIAPAISLNTVFTTQQTGRRLISDINTITTPITTEFNTFGRIHIFRFDDKTLAMAFSQTTDAKIFTFEPVTLTANFLLDTGAILDSGDIDLQVNFTDDFDGDTQLNSGKITCATAFTTLQTGAMLRKDINDIVINTSFGIELDAVGVVIDNTVSINSEFDFDTTTGRIHIFTFAPHVFATSLALNETGKIHIFRFTPHTFSTAFDFDTTGRIHIFRFVPRTFNIATTFNPNTGKIHLFNLPPITLPIQTIFDRNGGLRVPAQPTLDTNITVDVFAPIPLAPITLDTSLTLSQPTVEIVKQSNVVTAKAQTRTRLVRPHPRTVDAKRLETVSSLTLQAWQDVAQWLDLDSFEGYHRLTHRTTVNENRTVKADVSTRTLMVSKADRDEIADEQTAVTMVNADIRSYTVEHQHSYNVRSHDRRFVIPKTHTDTHHHYLVTADTETRRILAERLT